MDNLEMAQEAVRKGERTRVLFDLLLSELGMNYENTQREVFVELRKTQEEYEEAVQNLASVIRQHNEQKKTPLETELENITEH